MWRKYISKDPFICAPNSFSNVANDQNLFILLKHNMKGFQEMWLHALQGAGGIEKYGPGCRNMYMQNLLIIKLRRGVKVKIPI